MTARRGPGKRGVRREEARRLLLELANVAEGTSYGMPSFLLNGRFLARFRDDDTVMVLQLATISDREMLMQMDPRAFFFTDHYRNYPAVLIRLADVPKPLFADVVTEAWRHVSSLPLPRRWKKRPARRLGASSPDGGGGGSKLNREWHKANRMPPGANRETRLQWHLEHVKRCGCRPIPKGLLPELSNRGRK
jgi:hypothetical protein